MTTVWRVKGGPRSRCGMVGHMGPARARGARHEAPGRKRTASGPGRACWRLRRAGRALHPARLGLGPCLGLCVIAVLACVRVCVHCALRFIYHIL